jgi:hypothetical protein
MCRPAKPVAPKTTTEDMHQIWSVVFLLSKPFRYTVTPATEHQTRSRFPDRWHLPHNLSDAVDRVARTSLGCLREQPGHLECSTGGYHALLDADPRQDRGPSAGLRARVASHPPSP